MRGELKLDSQTTASAIDLTQVCAVYQHYLGRLQHLLDAAQRFGVSDEQLQQLRLAPDMLPCATQAAVACNMVLRSVLPLAGRPVALGAFADTHAGLRQRIAHAQQALADAGGRASVPPNTPLAEDLWGQRVELPAWQHHALLLQPNFFFHLGMVYAMLRHAGVPLGKGDFDGFTPKLS